MKLQGGVINGPKNPQFVFRSTLTGEVRNEDAELTVDYVDGKGRLVCCSVLTPVR